MVESPEPGEALEQVIRLVRASFHRLKIAGEELHRHLGVTTAMRCVLKDLVETGEQTVPQIARAKSVSRQHIQSLADSLVAARLVEFRPNPAHRRSLLLDLTPHGRSVFAAMQRAEAPVLSGIAAGLPDADLAATRRVLAALNAALERRQTAVITDPA